MYLDYYELKTKPFQITVDPKFLWLGDKHREALATLRYGIMDNRGFLLLTGEVGTGKTILINELTTILDIGTVVATIPDPDLLSMDFYNLLADGFHMNRTFDSKSAFLIQLRDFLHQSNSDNKQVLLIIDESQRLNHQLMEDIRVLSNIELHDRKLINVFFVGQPEFNNILMTPQNRALAQRITVRYHIEPLDLNETEKYIQHRLKMAGSKRTLFKKSALPEIQAFSGGIPRLINIICDHALLTGFSQNKKEIDAAIVRECAEELKIPVKQPTYGTAVPPIAAKTAREPTHTSNRTATEAPGASKVFHPAESSGNSSTKRSKSSIVLVIFLVLLFAGLTAFAITQLSQTTGPRFDSEELTPKKYLSTLEKEKEKLSDRLERGDVATDPVATGADTGHRNETNGEMGSAKQKDGPTPLDKKDSKAPADQTSFLEGEIVPLPLMKEKILIHFSLNSNDIEPSAYAVLDRIAAYLKKHTDEIVNVRGYTDGSGPESYNVSVSRFRANAVKSYLLGKGAPADNIQTFAMGSSNPIASNDSAEGRSSNRRVEVEFPPNGAADQ